MTRFVTLGVSLAFAICVVETDESTRQAEAGERLRVASFDTVAQPWVWALAVAAVGCVVVACWAQRRPRGVEPAISFPAHLRCPDPAMSAGRTTHHLDVAAPVAITRRGVLDESGELIGAISHRSIGDGPTAVHTFWSAPGVAAFSVGSSQRHIGTDESSPTVSSWMMMDGEQPVDGTGVYEMPDGRVLMFQGGRWSCDVLRVPMANGAISDRAYAIVDRDGSTVAEITRRLARWVVVPSADLTRDRWMGVLVATLWVEHTYLLNHPPT